MSNKKIKRQREIETRIDGILKSGIAGRIEVGGLLQEAKDDVLDHGEFLPWIKTRWSFSESSAQNFMKAHKLATKFPTVGDSKLSPTALYWLADEYLSGDHEDRWGEILNAVLKVAMVESVDRDSVILIIAEASVTDEQRAKAKEVSDKFSAKRAKQAARKQAKFDAVVKEHQAEQQRAEPKPEPEVAAANAEAEAEARKALYAGQEPEHELEPEPKPEPDRWIEQKIDQAIAEEEKSKKALEGFKKACEALLPDMGIDDAEEAILYANEVLARLSDECDEQQAAA